MSGHSHDSHNFSNHVPYRDLQHGGRLSLSALSHCTKACCRVVFRYSTSSQICSSWNVLRYIGLKQQPVSAELCAHQSYLQTCDAVQAWDVGGASHKIMCGDTQGHWHDCWGITRIRKTLANLYQALLFTLDAYRILCGIADVQRREGV